MKKVISTFIPLVFLAACSSDNESTTFVLPTEQEALDTVKIEYVKANYNLLDIPNSQPTVDAVFWKNALDKTWQGIKKRNYLAYSTGLIHRPKSEKPGDAVSEGVGYGMLVALFANDQETFNTIWYAANTYMWGSCYFNWQVDQTGKVTGRGAASDAEQDIALALIFAQKLVDTGKWQSLEKGSYIAGAQTILGCMWNTRQITASGVLAPGAGWGGESFVNPGYFSPAWYKIFAEVDPTHNWLSVASNSYTIISTSPGAANGMVLDWMTLSGAPASSRDLGYNAYGGGTYFYKDAIRILWRVAIDAIWFNDPIAIAFLGNAIAFINSKGGAEAANFYQMDGSLIPEEDMWTDLAGGTIARPRREHSPLTIAMWATAAMAAGTDEDKKNFSRELAKYYEDGADYFGLSVDTTGAMNDTLHNEMYFEQFLGWFGASLMSGTFTNVINALNNPVSSTEGLLTEVSEVH